MTTRISENRRPTRNRIVLGLIAIASVTGLSATAAPAWAVTNLTAGHVDVVFVDINQAGNKLELGTNDEANGVWYPGATAVSDLRFHVGSNSNGVVTPGVWTLQQEEIPANSVGQLWAGLAASGDADPAGQNGLRDFLTPGSHSIVLKLTNLVKPSGSTATLKKDGTIRFDSIGDQQSYGLSATEPESYHQHTEWNFSTAGTYTFTFEASTNKSGVTKSDPVTYTFVVQ